MSRNSESEDTSGNSIAGIDLAHFAALLGGYALLCLISAFTLDGASDTLLNTQLEPTGGTTKAFRVPKNNSVLRIDVA